VYDDATVGARLRTLRRWRRMTLAQLAGQAGLSVSFLSMAERGQRALDRRSHISALAAALQVSETELLGGPHLGDDPLRAGPHAAIPPIRVALQTNTLTAPAVDRARPIDELAAELRRVEAASAVCDYIELGRLLPPLLDELHYHIAQPIGEREQRVALEMLIEACHPASVRSKDLGYPDLAYLAAARADAAARMLDDPIAIGKATYLLIQAMPRAGSWERTHAAALRAATALQPHARTDVGIAVLGMLTLMAALSAAVSLRLDDAEDLLNEATELATRVPDDPVNNWGSFSATNVGGWRVAIAVETGRTGRGVLEIAERIDRSRYGTRRSRHAMLLADVGRGLAKERSTRDQAIEWLREAERIAPQRIRNDARVRETVAVLLEQSRAAAAGRELRGMAARMGVPH